MRGTKGTEICDGERNMFPLGVTADGRSCIWLWLPEKRPAG